MYTILCTCDRGDAPAVAHRLECRLFQAWHRVGDPPDRGAVTMYTILCTCDRGDAPAVAHRLECRLFQAWENAEDERMAERRYELRQKHQEKGP